MSQYSSWPPSLPFLIVIEGKKIFIPSEPMDAVAQCNSPWEKKAGSFDNA